MSSTQMDLSPIIINRKQDIASWSEGDIDQLTARDKNRYQKRKAAVIEYFQSDLPVEEISARHRLSAVDALETMARRCCMLHKDGQPWGFRALVPGARVVDAARTTTSDAAVRGGETSEEKVERKAAAFAKFASLPHTPIPACVEDEKAPSEIEEAQVDFAEERTNGQNHAEIEQEEFPTTIAAAEDLATEEQSAQEEFSSSADEVVAQEEFPTLAPAEEAAKAEAQQDELPLVADEMETADEAIIPEAEVEQEEFPPATAVVEVETAEEEQADQEEPASSANEVEAATEPESAQEHAQAVVEAAADEDARQEEFPPVAEAVEAQAAEEEAAVAAAAPGEVETAQSTAEAATVEKVAANDEITQEEFPVPTGEVQVSDDTELLAEDEDLEGEPTGKLSVVRPVARTEAAEAATTEVTEPTDAEEEKTAELVAGQNAEIEAEEDAEIAIEEEKRTEEQDSEIAVEEEKAEEEVAELDTVEVAKVVAEERLNRVVAAETIKVPAAMLDALEKADRELQARTEAAATVLTSTEETDAEERALVAQPATQELTQPSSATGEVQDKDKVAAIPTQTLEAWRRDSHQLTQAPSQKSPTQSLVEDSRYRITGSQAAIKHAVRRRWGKQGRQQKYRRWVRIVSAAIIVSILVILLIPLGVGLVGYNAYTNIKNVANDGVSNLLTLKDLMPANKNDMLSALNTQKLATAKTNLQKAQNDFLQLQDMVNRPDIESLLQQFAPQYSNKLDMARRLVQVALDVSRMGQELVGVGQMGASVLHGGGSLLSSSSTKPLFTADDVNTIEAALQHAQYYISDIQMQMSQVNLAEIPFGSAAQKTELAKYLNQIPQAQSAITQAQSLVGPVAWLLGVGQTRHFLVQTLDRAELRPSGGFEGQYGILTLQNGRMSPFTLKDITGLDYAENGAELQRLPPSQYSWMNFGNWGVRDANLSADYPTNAQLVMRVFQEEGGGPVDGDIQFTPVLISQLLQLTGPLYVKEYHETITAQNLEDKLHYYQQDYNAISVERDKTGTNNASTRKAFTALVGKLLLDRVHSLKLTQLMDFGKVLLKDLQTRDLQVYFTNPAAEQWLAENGYSGAMPRFTNGNDGFMVVQANISISKATQYVHSTFNDQVTLDAQGGATHNLTIQLDYNQKGPVYGFDTYTDYVRVYAPANAQFQGGSGFVDTHHTLCTPSTTKKGTGSGNGNGGGTSTGTSGTPIGCGQYNGYYPGDGRYCASGNYSLGTGYVAGKGFIPWPVYAPSGPTEMQSDLAGYQMWGGLTQTPKNCTSTISLTWYVPHAVQITPGKAPYQMIVGHQAGWPDTAKISIDASALKSKGVKSLDFNKTISVDTTVALTPLPLPPSQNKPGNGTPTPAVTPTSTPKKP